MPNWCENDLYIKGSNPKAVLDAIGDKKYPFDFERIIPMPQSLHITSPQHTAEEKAQAKKNLKLYGATDWYNWAHNNWGTKWNACESKVLYKKAKSAKVTFSTAWAPPVPVIVALAKKFPTYTFTLKFFEMGMAYQGTVVIKGDKILKEEEKKYHGHRGG